MPYFTRYQWTVLFAAWLGWGFDVFDGLLFNYVAPDCVPTLLGLPIDSAEAKQATLYWTGATLYFAIGVSVFGSFTYYLPELFPTRVRGTGSGFCCNVGRVIAASGPFLVGSIAARGGGAPLEVLTWVGFVPLAGLLLMPLVVETRGRALQD